uniref:Uncharacterized protein n=1 Tax=Solanum lycopersicum TaxID=4081 RepID=A0A494G8S2_SOLLC
MASHSGRRLTVFDVQGPCCHAPPDIVYLYLQSKGDDGMLCLRSTDRVSCRRSMMTFHAQHRSTYKSDDGMPWLSSSNIVCCSMAMMRMPRPTSSYHVCCPRAMMECHS